MKEEQAIKPERGWEPDHEVELELDPESSQEWWKDFKEEWSEHSYRYRREARVGENLVGEDPLGSCCGNIILLI